MKKEKIIEENKNQLIFVDRINEREEFWNKLNLNQKEVINYYGIDGMGKTTLMNQLINELKEKDSKIYFVYIDIESCSSPLGILDAIRNILSTNYKINFKKFDLALGVYYTKIGKNQNSPEIKENSVYKTINEFFSSISLSTLFIGKVVDKIVTSNFFRQNQEFAKYLSYEFPNTILSNLHKYLAEDINLFLEKEKSRMIFFIDAFEKLDQTKIGSSSSISKTNWLYNHNKNGLMDLIENSFWVINSTEKIWENNSNSIELSTFNKEYTFEYLKNYGITDENICNKIFENYSYGIPTMLAYCVDCYNANMNEFYENEFMENIDELIERLIGDLDIDSKSIVYFLACLKKWVDDLVEELAPKCLSPFLETRYIEIKKLSFVTKNLTDNTYSIDKNIRKIILMSNDEMGLIVKKTYSVLENYYKEIINSESRRTSEKIFSMNEYIDINKNIDFEFVKKFLTELEKACLYEEELDLIEKLENNSDDISIKNNILKEKIHVYQLLGKYNLQEEWSKIYDEANNTVESKEILANSYMFNGNYLLAYDILIKLFKENSNDLSIIKNLADVESRLGYYDKALEHYIFIENQLDSGVVESSISKKVVEESIAKTYSFMGDYQKSIDILKKLLNVDNEDISEILAKNIKNMTIEDLNVYSYIGTTYSNAGNFEEALKIKRVLLDFYENALGPKHPYYLNIENEIAMIYSHLGKWYEEAIKMLEDVYESRKEILGEDKPSTIAALNNLGIVTLYSEKRKDGDKNLENLNLALEYLTKSYNLRKEILGEFHPNTMSSLFNLALVQDELGNKDEAKKIANQVYDYRVVKLGKNHRDTKITEEFISISLK